MRIFRRASVLALVAQIILIATAQGHFVEWASWSEQTYITGPIYGTRIPDDTYRMRTTMYWENTRTTNMRHMATEYGYRFSDDVHVTACTLSATTRRETNLENPYFDRDAHNSCGDYLFRFEEAEITAEDAGAITFPISGATYYTNFYYMRWACNGSMSVCGWDPSPGTASYTESISEANYLGGDKWNTVPGEFATLPAKSFPYYAKPTAALAVDEGSAGLHAGRGPGRPAAATPGAAGAATTREAFSLKRGDKAGEVYITPDLSRGLDAYAVAAKSLAKEIVARGPARAVVTFSAPVDDTVLGELTAAGLVIHDVEAVSDTSADGTHWTVGDRFGVDLSVAMGDIAEEHDVTFLGVSAAEVTVPSAAVLHYVQTHPAVWLVDVSTEQVARTRNDVKDVGQNDLWWWLAGW